MSSAAVTSPFDLTAASEPISEKSTQILDAALALFLEFGLRKTSIDDVAKRAGIGRITVYRYFADKNALFQAVVLRECQVAMQQIRRSLEKIDSPAERIIEGFVLAVSGARNHPLISRLMQTEPEWLLPHLTIQGESLVLMGSGYIAELIRREQERTQRASGDLEIELVAELMWRLLQSSLLTPGGRLAPQHDDSALRQVAEHFLLPLFSRFSSAKN